MSEILLKDEKMYRAWSKLDLNGTGYSKGNMSVSVTLQRLIEGFMEEYKSRNNTTLTAKKIIDQVIFMESTGVNGSKGELIFQNDIVERVCTSVDCPLKHRGVVVYNNPTAMWCIKEENNLSPLVIPDYNKGKLVSILGITKLGNIFENPELVDATTLDGIL